MASKKNSNGNVLQKSNYPLRNSAGLSLNEAAVLGNFELLKIGNSLTQQNDGKPGLLIRELQRLLTNVKAAENRFYESCGCNSLKSFNDINKELSRELLLFSSHNVMEAISGDTTMGQLFNPDYINQKSLENIMNDTFTEYLNSQEAKEAMAQGASDGIEDVIASALVSKLNQLRITEFNKHNMKSYFKTGEKDSLAKSFNVIFSKEKGYQVQVKKEVSLYIRRRIYESCLIDQSNRGISTIYFTIPKNIEKKAIQKQKKEANKRKSNSNIRITTDSKFLEEEQIAKTVKELFKSNIINRITNKQFQTNCLDELDNFIKDPTRYALAMNIPSIVGFAGELGATAYLRTLIKNKSPSAVKPVGTDLSAAIISGDMQQTGIDIITENGGFQIKNWSKYKLSKGYNDDRSFASVEQLLDRAQFSGSVAEVLKLFFGSWQFNQPYSNPTLARNLENYQFYKDEIFPKFREINDLYMERIFYSHIDKLARISQNLIETSILPTGLQFNTFFLFGSEDLIPSSAILEEIILALTKSAIPNSPDAENGIEFELSINAPTENTENVLEEYRSVYNPRISPDSLLNSYGASYKLTIKFKDIMNKVASKMQFPKS